MHLLEKFRNREPVRDDDPQKVIAGWDWLKYLNKRAEKQDFNGQLNLGVLRELVQKDLLPLNEETAIGNIENVIFVITTSFIHNDTEVRVLFTWGNQDHTPFLDVSFTDYDNLLSLTELKRITESEETHV